MAEKARFLVKEKNLLVYKSEGEIEITLQLAKKKGLVLSVGWDQKGHIEVVVMKTMNGCPGVGKPEFCKIYRR